MPLLSGTGTGTFAASALRPFLSVGEFPCRSKGAVSMPRLGTETKSDLRDLESPRLTGTWQGPQPASLWNSLA